MKRKLWAKALAFVLCVLTVIITIASAIATAGMASNNFYTADLTRIRTEMLKSLVYKNCYNVSGTIRYGDKDLLTNFDSENFFYEVFDDEGKLIAGNYNGEDFFVMVEDDHYYLTYENIYKNEKNEGDSLPVDSEVSPVTEYEPESYAYDSVAVPETEEYDIKSEPPAQVETNPEAVTVHYHIKGYIPTKYTKTDIISITDYWIKIAYEWKYAIPVIGFVSLILTIIFFIFLMDAAGWKENGEKVYENVFDRIPFDLFTVIIGSVVAALILCCFYFYLEGIEIIIMALAVCMVAIPLTLFYFMSVATRAKAGTLFKNTLVCHFAKYILRFIRFVFSRIKTVLGNLPVYGKAIIALGVFFMWEFIMCLFFAYGEGDMGGFMLGTGWIVLSVFIFYVANNLYRIKKGGEKIASGDLSNKIRTERMLPGLRHHANALNSIGEGMSIAVEDKLKSERFKTELITNVSHDLKTPLTSIVNYVDLLKGELSSDAPDREKTTEYIDVLERQSARLRKLTEDLVEASKASTGNLEVKREPLELGEFISQVEGEYREKLKTVGLELILRRPDTPVMTMADGRHLWRVLDNLMNNVVKYALAGTRVYLDIATSGTKARIIVRNTSKYAIGVSAEQLGERFVRGDLSRHTEGSGLGLSIAKSLIELQGGNMSICVDGDLFKVTLELTCEGLPK